MRNWVKSDSLYRWSGMAGVALLAMACGGQAVPPAALVSAREAYTVAQAGPANDLAPAKLDTAKQALDAAEGQWLDDPDAVEPETVSLAYIAERRARTAGAIGETEKSVREKKKLDEEYLELERKRANMTEEELARVRERMRNEGEKARMQMAQKDAALAATSAELEKERQARENAEKSLSAAVASLKEMASVKEEARGMVITLNGAVLFTSGKDQLLPMAKSKLDEVASALAEQGFKKIVIEGHTDSRGTVKQNESLSLNRATAVKTHLVSRGLDSAKIDAVGLASTRPVDTNDTQEGRANNRRVEIVVTSK
jgi:outer membrane protein OmpA-like peptidoglycan-associated protein